MNDKQVLGYVADGTPIYETPAGAFTTRAAMTCCHCGETIKMDGGPLPRRYCRMCFAACRPNKEIVYGGQS